MFCPICRYKDKSCKVRFLGEQPLFSCQGCFEREERRRAGKPRSQHDLLDDLGYRGREPSTQG